MLTDLTAFVFVLRLFKALHHWIVRLQLGKMSSCYRNMSLPVDNKPCLHRCKDKRSIKLFYWGLYSVQSPVL